MNSELGTEPPKDQEPSARRAGWERPTRIAVASLAVIAILFLFVFPTRSYLAQERQVRAARRAVEVLKAQNREMAREARELESPGEIERLARAQFNMVRPGEHVYNMIPSARPTPSTTTTVP